MKVARCYNVNDQDVLIPVYQIPSLFLCVPISHPDDKATLQHLLVTCKAFLQCLCLSLVNFGLIWGLEKDACSGVLREC